MVEQYLQAYFNTKKWYFIPVLQVFSELKGMISKEDIRKELNDLVNEGKIAKRKGVNGDLIEIIVNNN